MKNVSVIFDTNAYRDLCGTNPPLGGWNVATMVARESSRGITSYANPYVIMELASHLWDAKRPAFAECRAGLTALYEHCRIDGSDEFRLFADSESQIAHMLFGKEPSGSAETTQVLAKFTEMVANAPPGPLPSDMATDSKMLADRLDTRETAFIDDMKSVVMRLNPAASGWNPLATDPASRDALLKDVRSPKMLNGIALGHVLKARRQLGMPLNAPTLDIERDAVLKVGAASITLYREILVRLVSTGCDMTKKGRQNWIWDMMITFAIGQDFGHPPMPLVLVTGDQDIVDAAHASALGAFVRHLPEYLDSLQTTEYQTPPGAVSPALHGHNPLYLPTKLMRENDLVDGDWAKVTSPHGEITVPVLEMAALNENTIWTWNAIGKRKGTWALDEDAPESTKGFLLNHLIHELLPPKGDGLRWANSDPITGQAAWFDLKVRVEKATPSPEEAQPVMPPIKSPVGTGPKTLSWKVGK